MTQKRILVLGASELQLSLINKVKEKGFYLGVVDFNENAVGVKYADEFFCISTTDENGVYQAAKAFKADAIVTMATDMPMRAIAFASKKLGLKSISYDTALKSTDKALMIKAFKEYNVPSPEFIVLSPDKKLDKETFNIKFPCICKPTDSSGSRGVFLAKSLDELENCIKYSFSQSRSGNVIIEEYLCGQEISVEALCINNNINILSITEKITTGAPHFVELGHTEPGRFSSSLTKKINEVAKKACKAVGIDNGPAHIEMMITSDGPKLIELGARMGGDFITSDLVPISTGIDMIYFMIKTALGERVDIHNFTPKGAAIRYFNIKKGVLKNIIGADKAKNIPGINKIHFDVDIGDTIDEIKSSVNRTGYVIAYGETADSAEEAAELAIKEIKFEVM